MKIKMLSKEIQHPKKAYRGDAGFDVQSLEDYVLQPGETHQFKLGFAMQVSEYEVVIMSERSGMAIKHSITSIGNVIDSNYRGEVSIILHNLGKEPYEINKFDRIGQFMIMRLGEQFINMGSLDKSDRGTNAHTSSGK